MKLKVFTIEDRVDRTATGLRSVSVRRKGRQVTLSRRFVSEENIKKDDTTFALLAFDEDSKQDWYLTIGNHRNGYKINSHGDKSGKGFTLYFCVGKVAGELLDTCKIKESGTFLVAENPTEFLGETWYKIITTKPINLK